MRSRSITARTRWRSGSSAYALMLGIAAPLLSFAPPSIAPAFLLIAAAEGVLFLWLLIFGIRR